MVETVLHTFTSLMTKMHGQSAVQEASTTQLTAEKTWQRQLGEQQRNNFREVLFYDDTTGWIASSDGTLFETQDGGNTWEKLAIRINQRLIGIHFASLDPKWGWTMRSDGTVLYTTDGNTWTAGDTPERPPFIEGDPPGRYSINDVDFGKFSEGWAVGRFGDIIHNKDGGPTWTLQRTTANDTLTSVDMKFAPLGWAGRTKWCNPKDYQRWRILANARIQHSYMT